MARFSALLLLLFTLAVLVNRLDEDDAEDADDEAVLLAFMVAARFVLDEPIDKDELDDARSLFEDADEEGDPLLTAVAATLLLLLLLLAVALRLHALCWLFSVVLLASKAAVEVVEATGGVGELADEDVDELLRLALFKTTTLLFWAAGFKSDATTAVKEFTAFDMII